MAVVALSKAMAAAKMTGVFSMSRDFFINFDFSCWPHSHLARRVCRSPRSAAAGPAKDMEGARRVFRNTDWFCSGGTRVDSAQLHRGERRRMFARQQAGDSLAPNCRSIHRSQRRKQRIRPDAGILPAHAARMRSRINRAAPRWPA